MATLTARPQEKLIIKHKRVLDAYFAERINDAQHKESTTPAEPKEHTVESGDTLGKLAKKYTTTVAKIKVDNGLTTDTIVLGKVLKIATEPKKEKIGDKVTFKRMGAAKLGDEVYVIVETENLSDVEVCINVKQGKTDNPELEFESKGMFIAQEGNNDISLAKATVGAYSKDALITNKDDFANWAIFKITLGARHQEDIGEALEKLDNKKAFLFLVVDAHTRNKIDINYDGQNEDDETTFTNRWLDIQGKWFELKSNRVVEYSIFYDGKIEKTDVKEPKKAIYNYYDSNNMKHLLGEAEISKTKRHIKKDTVTTKDDYIFLAYAKDIQNYNSDGVKFAFAEWTSSSGRWYINPDCFAGLIGAMIEESIEDLGFNGFSIKNGNTAGGSSSHINGEKGDLRYLSTNLNGERTYLQDTHFDYERQVKFNNALYKFGWGRLGKMYSENFNRTTINKVLNPKTNKIEEQEIVTSTLLPHTKHMKKTEGTPKYRHHHHIHLTGFKHSKVILK